MIYVFWHYVLNTNTCILVSAHTLFSIIFCNETPLEFSTSFKDFVKFWQTGDLQDITIKERFRRNQIPTHRREKDVLDLPSLSLTPIFFLFVITFLGGGWDWGIEICKFA